MFYVLVFIWFAYWSAEAGASLPWSKKWQNSFLKTVPELVIAATISICALVFWNSFFPMSYDWAITLFFIFGTISFLGKESATWAYLTWEGYTKDKNNDGVIDDQDGRDSTMREWNDALAAKLGYRLGDEGYSWVWAFTKGLITTLPLGGFGAIFQPIGREIFSHAKGRLPGDPNTYMEAGGDGFGYTMAVLVAVIIGGV